MPGADDEEIANIMEEVLPSPEEMPLMVDAEELEALLEGDAAIVQEMQAKAIDSTSGDARIEEEIAQEAVKLRRNARLRRAASAPGPGQRGSRGGPETEITEPRPLITHEIEQPRISYWRGKGGASWSPEENSILVFVVSSQMMFLCTYVLIVSLVVLASMNRGNSEVSASWVSVWSGSTSGQLVCGL